MLTIITPTYNRAHLLENAFRSLESQTKKDFEWIIVDDGSTDDTRSLVQMFMSSKLRITYVYQRNAGKHVALNTGIQKAGGDLIIVLDSDDILDRKAVEIIKKYWEKYRTNKNIWALTFLKDLGNKKNIDKFEETIANSIDFRYNENRTADMTEVMRADVLKKNLFPVFGEETFLSEAVLYNKLAEKYDMVFIPKIIYHAEYRKDGLSKNWLKNVTKNPLGARANSLSFMSKRFNFKIRLKNCIMFNVFSIIAHKHSVKVSPMKFCAVVFYFPSFVVVKILSLKYNKRED